MALRNTPSSASTQTPVADAKRPGFEAMPEEDHDTATAEQAEQDAAVTKTHAEASAKVEATTAIAVAKTGGLSLSKNEASAFAQEVESLRGAADFSYGNYQVFKGNNGEIVSSGEKQTTLGRWAKVSMIAWDDHFEVSPGDDSEKSRELVGYSKDGVTVDRVIGEKYAAWAGKTVASYVEYLKNDLDYSRADCRRFIDVGCVVHETESNDDFAGEIIQVTLSKSSIPSFTKYQERLVQKARAIARGIPGVSVPADPFTFYFLRQLASANGKNWTKLEVLDKLPSKI